VLPKTDRSHAAQTQDCIRCGEAQRGDLLVKCGHEFQCQHDHQSIPLAQYAWHCAGRSLGPIPKAPSLGINNQQNGQTLRAVSRRALRPAIQ